MNDIKCDVTIYNQTRMDFICFKVKDTIAVYHNDRNIDEVESLQNVDDFVETTDTVTHEYTRITDTFTECKNETQLLLE